MKRRGGARPEAKLTRARMSGRFIEIFRSPGFMLQRGEEARRREARDKVDARARKRGEWWI